MIFENLKQKKIILASNSPRRKEILTNLGLDFEVKLKPGIEEHFPEDLAPSDVALFLAGHKANEFDAEIDDKTIVITADTIVALGDEIINKPENESHAREMLKQLSGKKHSVYTGVCIKTKNFCESFYCKSDVYFKKLDTFEIDYYVDKFKPLDKAGAYGVQEWIGFAGIERIDGSYFNVMGLPSDMVYERLKKM